MAVLFQQSLPLPNVAGGGDILAGASAEWRAWKRRERLDSARMLATVFVFGIFCLSTGGIALTHRQFVAHGNFDQAWSAFMPVVVTTYVFAGFFGLQLVSVLFVCGRPDVLVRVRCVMVCALALIPFALAIAAQSAEHDARVRRGESSDPFTELAARHEHDEFHEYQRGILVAASANLAAAIYFSHLMAWSRGRKPRFCGGSGAWRPDPRRTSMYQAVPQSASPSVSMRKCKASPTPTFGGGGGYADDDETAVHGAHDAPVDFGGGSNLQYSDDMSLTSGDDADKYP